jgi:hypothetical protein
MPIDVTALLRTALRRLETERDRVDRQMAALKTALDGVNVASKASRQRGPMSEAARRALSRRMKAYWAKRKAAKQEPRRRAEPNPPSTWSDADGPTATFEMSSQVTRRGHADPSARTASRDRHQAEKRCRRRTRCRDRRGDMSEEQLLLDRVRDSGVHELQHADEDVSIAFTMISL